MKFEKTHIKALLDHPQTREGILGCLDNKRLAFADIESLSSSDFDDLCDAALDTFGNCPIAKEYMAEGGWWGQAREEK